MTAVSALKRDAFLNSFYASWSGIFIPYNETAPEAQQAATEGRIAAEVLRKVQGNASLMSATAMAPATKFEHDMLVDEVKTLRKENAELHDTIKRISEKMEILESTVLAPAEGSW